MSLLRLYCDFLPSLQSCFLHSILTDVIPEVSPDTFCIEISASVCSQTIQTKMPSVLNKKIRADVEAELTLRVFLTGEMSVKRSADIFPEAEQLS